MEIRAQASVLKMTGEDLKEFSEIVKKCNWEIRSVKQILGRQSVFAQEIQQITEISDALQSNASHLLRMSYGLERIGALYQHTEEAVEAEFESRRPAYEPIKTTMVDLTPFEKRANTLFYGEMMEDDSR